MQTTTATTTRAFAIDATHSEAAFSVRHLISKVRGRFTRFEGTIEFDAERPERSAVSVSLEAASIDTGVPDRDQHLRSDDFFAAATYPALTYVSTAITPKGGDAYEVAGTLTIRGVARPVTLQATLLGTATDPWGNQRLAFEAETAINRKDFGLNWNAALETGGFLVGDEVTITLSVQAVGK